MVRALLTVDRQVAIDEVVAGQALVAGDPSAFKDREMKAGEPTHSNIVGS